jgi:hypothetical protein
VGQATELVWTIRFRPRFTGTGALLRRIVGSALRKALRERLKPLVEGGQRPTFSRSAARPLLESAPQSPRPGLTRLTRGTARRPMKETRT